MYPMCLEIIRLIRYTEKEKRRASKKPAPDGVVALIEELGLKRGSVCIWEIPTQI